MSIKLFETSLESGREARDGGIDFEAISTEMVFKAGWDHLGENRGRDKVLAWRSGALQYLEERKKSGDLKKGSQWGRKKTKSLRPPLKPSKENV